MEKCTLGNPKKIYVLSKSQMLKYILFTNGVVSSLSQKVLIPYSDMF